MNNSIRPIYVTLLACTLCSCAAPQLSEPHSIASQVASRTGVTARWGADGTLVPDANALEHNSAVALPNPLDEAAAVAIALDASPDLAEQFAQTQALRAEALETATPLNPVLNFASGVPLDSMGVVPVFAMLMAQVDELWKQPMRSDAARDSYEAALLSLGSAAVTIAAETRALWHETQQLDEELLVAQADSELSERLLQMARAHLSAGEGTADSVAQVEAQYVESHHRVERTSQARAQARLSLMRILGRSAAPLDWTCGAQDASAFTSVHGEIPDEASLLSRMVESRLDVRAAQARARSAAARVLLAENSRIGRLEIGSGWERTMENDSGVGFAANLEIPIFNNGSNRIARAVADYRAACIAAEKKRQDAIVEVRAAMAAALATQNTHAMSSAATLQSSMLTSARAQQAFAAGEQSERSLLDAQRALNQVRMEITKLERERRSARVALTKASGFLPAEEVQ